MAPNPASNPAIKIKISRLWGIPEHQQDIRCKAPRSDDRGVWSNTPQGGAIEGNAADDVLMVDQGGRSGLLFEVRWSKEDVLHHLWRE